MSGGKIQLQSTFSMQPNAIFNSTSVLLCVQTVIIFALANFQLFGTSIIVACFSKERLDIRAKSMENLKRSWQAIHHTQLMLKEVGA